MKKSVIAAALVLMAGCCAFEQPASADSTYTYTGNAYTSCSGSYASSGSTCAGAFAPSITLDVISGTPLDNLTLFGAGSNITADVSAFSFTDGSGLNINQANTSYLSIVIGTDVSGDITSWNIYGGCYDQVLAQCLYSYSGSYDESIQGNPVTGTAINYADSGTWTQQVTGVPEPSILLLLASGFALLVGLTGVTKQAQG